MVAKTHPELMTRERLERIGGVISDDFDSEAAVCLLLDLAAYLMLSEQFFLDSFAGFRLRFIRQLGEKSIAALAEESVLQRECREKQVDQQSNLQSQVYPGYSE